MSKHNSPYGGRVHLEESHEQHRWALTPISVITDQRYWTELDIGTSDIGLKRAESDIISDIGINF